MRHNRRYAFSFVYGANTLTGPKFFVLESQPPRTVPILLATVTTVGALFAIAYGLAHTGKANRTSGGSENARTAGGAAGASPAAEDEDDPSQVDVIAIGDAADAPVPAHRMDHGSSVHPTVLIHLPRFGEQEGLIPDTAAGHLLFRWLAAFNQADPDALRNTLPNEDAALADAQMELRRRTGGLRLLSAKEVQPGLLVFRLRDQTPEAREALGSLQVRTSSGLPEVASFSLRSFIPTVTKNPFF